MSCKFGSCLRARDQRSKEVTAEKMVGVGRGGGRGRQGWYQWAKTGFLVRRVVLHHPDALTRPTTVSADLSSVKQPPNFKLFPAAEEGPSPRETHSPGLSSTPAAFGILRHLSCLSVCHVCPCTPFSPGPAHLSVPHHAFALTVPAPDALPVFSTTPSPS